MLNSFPKNKKKSMTEPELQNFIIENDIKWDWRNNHITHLNDVVLFVHINDLGKFNKLLYDYSYNGKEYDCTMKKDFVFFWMKNLCERHNIEITNFFQK